MSKPENPNVHPIIIGEKLFDEGITLRDYFAIRAPEPGSDMLATQRGIDRARNPYNEPCKPPIRSEYEIRAYLAYKYADAMLAARTAQHIEAGRV